MQIGLTRRRIRLIARCVVPAVSALILSAAPPSPAHAAGWHRVAADCHDVRSTAVTRTVCYTKWKLGSDGNGSSDFYALEVSQTAWPRTGYKLQAVRVAAKPSRHSASMSLYGVGSYYPRTRITGPVSCNWTFSVTVSVKKFAASGSHRLCSAESIDSVNPLPTANVGDFGARWHVGGSRSGSRSVEAIGVVRVRQGAVPHWATVSTSSVTACRVIGPFCQGVYH